MVTHHTTFIGALNALYNSVLARTGDENTFDLTYFYVDAIELLDESAIAEIHAHPMYAELPLQFISSMGLGGEVDGGCIVGYGPETYDTTVSFFVVYSI